MIGTSTAIGTATSAPPRLSSVRRSIDVEVVSDYAAFLALKNAWNDTVERAGIGHPFLRHEWMQTWWECFGECSRLHIVLVRAGSRILAIAPLISETTKMYGVPVRLLRLMQNDHTQRIDVIVAERPDESYRAIWQSLMECRAAWDVCLFSQVPGESKTFTALPDLAVSSRCTTGVWRSDVSPYLELVGGFDEYIGTRSAKFRQNLRNRLSRLTRLGEPALEVLDTPASIRDACETALQLEASGWKQSEGSAICANPAVHRFYTRLAERASAAGWLRLLFLTVDGRRIAASYAGCYEDRLFLCKTGYDPEFAQYSPFKLLTYFAIRHGFASSLREVDFLGNVEPWKLEWTATSRPHDWLFVFANSSLGRFLHSLKFQVVPAVKRLRG